MLERIQSQGSVASSRPRRRMESLVPQELPKETTCSDWTTCSVGLPNAAFATEGSQLQIRASICSEFMAVPTPSSGAGRGGRCSSLGDEHWRRGEFEHALGRGETGPWHLSGSAAGADPTLDNICWASLLPGEMNILCRERPGTTSCEDVRIERGGVARGVDWQDKLSRGVREPGPGDCRLLSSMPLRGL